MTEHTPSNGHSSCSIRIFGVGDTGINVLNGLISDRLDPQACVAINMGGQALEDSAAAKKMFLESKRLRGLGSGGDPDRARDAAEERAEELQSLCSGSEVVFILAGLGGGTGTGVSPVLGRVAKAAGALVLAFVTTPFDCEGTRRQALADQGFEELREAVDGVICLPNQKIFKLIEVNSTVLATFKIVNRLLADGVLGVWRLLELKGLIEIHREDLCRLLQNTHSENSFAVAEAAGADRADAAVKKLLANPLLEDGDTLQNSDTVLVSIIGGPNLTLSEVDLVMAQIKAACPAAELIMGASVAEGFEDRLAITLIVGRKAEPQAVSRAPVEGLDTQLLARGAAPKPNTRILPPAPTLPPEQMRRLLSQQAGGRILRKSSSKLRQGQLPLEIVSKGRFDKSEPTIHKGEDLDVPTYIRRGVPLN